MGVETSQIQTISSSYAQSIEQFDMRPVRASAALAIGTRFLLRPLFLMRNFAFRKWHNSQKSVYRRKNDSGRYLASQMQNCKRSLDDAVAAIVSRNVDASFHLFKCHVAIDCDFITENYSYILFAVDLKNHRVLFSKRLSIEIKEDPYFSFECKVFMSAFESANISNILIVLTASRSSSLCDLEKIKSPDYFVCRVEIPLSEYSGFVSQSILMHSNGVFLEAFFNVRKEPIERITDIFCHLKRPSKSHITNNDASFQESRVLTGENGVIRCAYCLKQLPKHSLKALHHFENVCGRHLPISIESKNAFEGTPSKNAVILRPRKKLPPETYCIFKSAKKSKSSAKPPSRKRNFSRLGPPLDFAYHPLLMTKHAIVGDANVYSKVDFWHGVEDADPDSSTEIADLPINDPEIFEIFNAWNKFVHPLTKRPFKVGAIVSFLRSFLNTHKGSFNVIKLRHFVLCFVKFKIVDKHEALALFTS